MAGLYLYHAVFPFPAFASALLDPLGHDPVDLSAQVLGLLRERERAPSPCIAKPVDQLWARERAAMPEALVTLATESAVTERQRDIIYRALFRPAGTPQVDDAWPYQPVEKALGVATKGDANG